MPDHDVAPGHRICAATDLIDGGRAVRFAVMDRGERLPAFAVRFEGKVRAWVNRCAHRDAELDWMPGEVFDRERRWLICALHGALYDPESGGCVGGPCNGRALRQVAVEERGGVVYRSHAAATDQHL